MHPKSLVPLRQSLQSAHSDFNTALSPIVKEIISKSDTRLNAVMRWVDMDHLNKLMNQMKDTTCHTMARDNGKGSMALALHDDAGTGMANVVMCIPGRYMLCRHLCQ